MKETNYVVSWYASGLTFHYNGTETVVALDIEEAKEKAIVSVSKRMMMSRQLITIEEIMEIK